MKELKIYRINPEVPIYVNQQTTLSTFSYQNESSDGLPALGKGWDYIAAEDVDGAIAIWRKNNPDLNLGGVKLVCVKVLYEG